MKIVNLKIKVTTCAECKCDMIATAKPDCMKSQILHQLFPALPGSTLDDQLKDAGVCYGAYVRNADGLICYDCAIAGKARFTCECCELEKHTSRIEESFRTDFQGDGSFLCKDCYKTVPAEKWNAMVSGLREKYFKF